MFVGEAFQIFQKLFPFTPPAGWSFDDLNRRYARVDAGMVLGLFLAAPLLGYGWFAGFRYLADRLFAGLEPSAFRVFPETAYWVLPALFLALVSAALPLGLVLRLILGRDRLAEYLLYGNWKVGFDAGKVFRLFGGIAVLGALLMVGMGVRSYTLFTNETIVISRFGGIRVARYPYRQVAAVKEVIRREGTSAFVVEFTDGTRWGTTDGLRDPVPSDRRIAAFVAAKSGKPITRVMEPK